MRVLVVYAHPYPGSFCHAVLERVTSGLHDSGHTYEVIDLHRSRFDPVFRNRDYNQFMHESLPDDLVAQADLRHALLERAGGPVRRVVGELKVELERDSETISLSRPQEGTTATLSRTAKPDALVPLARRETRECLAEDMRRLDADEIYHAALGGISKVQYA